MRDQRFWFVTNGDRDPIVVPAAYVESIIMPAAKHEAGHIIAAHHLNAQLVGIAAGFRVDETPPKPFLAALYEWKDSTIENKCVAKAAGRAADILFHGIVDPQGDKDDLDCIEKLTGQASFEPFLGIAKTILPLYEKEFCAITEAFRDSLETEQDRPLNRRLSPDVLATYVLDEGELGKCFQKDSRTR